MSHNLSITEQLTHSTVRIECEVDGNPSTGTGFYYNFNFGENKKVPVVVTNKHVIEGADRGRIHITSQNNNGGPDLGNHKPIIFDNFERMWLKHPENSIDLCILPLAPLHEKLQETDEKLFYIQLDQSLLMSDDELQDLMALEEIAMIGYPNGIWDAENNLPLIRKGITSTHPKIDYNGEPKFMIDAACFPGSSGSPVFLLNIGGHMTKEGYNLGANRVKLLGILYAGPQHTATGEVEIIEVPTTKKAISVSHIPNNLGLVIKAKKLLDFKPLIEKRI
jgi:V8-like Glu-specific endopeptidase